MKTKILMNRKAFYLACVLLVSGLIGCQNQIEEKNCIACCVVGQEYVKKYIFDKENPFDKATYDTVVVLAIQDGYVKYREVNSNDTDFFLSTKVEYFMKDSKPFH